MRRCSGRSRAGWAALKVVGETGWTVAILCAAIVRPKSSLRPLSISLVVLAVALLTRDATLAMPPTPTWYRGRDAIAAFYARWVLSGELRWRHIPTRANCQPAVACYLWDPGTGSYVATVLDVLTLRGMHIAEITAFVDADVIRRFGLPDRLAR